MNLKKIGKILTSKSVGTGPSSYEKKKNLPGRGLTKVEQHWTKHLRDMKGSCHEFCKNLLFFLQ